MSVAAAVIDPRLVRAFADILDYPHAPLGDAVRECQALAAKTSPQAAVLLGRFRAFVEGASLGELQEAYTRAFDLDTLSEEEPTCYPYVGHQIFSENHKRSAFLVGLNERYRECGFSAGTELPDHVVVLLRFLAVCDDADLATELLDEAIVPALDGMIGPGAGPAEPTSGRGRYLQVLRALALVLAERPGAGERPAAVETSEPSDAGWALSPNGRD